MPIAAAIVLPNTADNIQIIKFRSLITFAIEISDEVTRVNRKFIKTSIYL